MHNCRKMNDKKLFLLKNLQQSCASLVKVRKLADDSTSITMRDGSEYKLTDDSTSITMRDGSEYKLADDSTSITMRDGSEYKFVVDCDLLFYRCTIGSKSRATFEIPSR